jgi:IS4 transposase
MLMAKARKLYADDKEFSLELEGAAYALDSTTIELCMALFPWAKFRTTKAGIKLHTLLDFKGSIPAFVHISDARVSDVKVLDVIIFESGAFYVMDRGYLDFARLYAIHLAGSFFVTRAKDNTKIRRLYSKAITEEEKKQGIRCDQIVVLSRQKARKDYQEKLRRIKYYDAENDQYYIFLTNNFILPVLTIAELYRYRWRVELFFKWIKQNLKVQSFWGYSENAVKTQIWIAMASYALVAVLKKKLNLTQSMNEILQILSISIFDKMALTQLFSKGDHKLTEDDHEKQLTLAGF